MNEARENLSPKYVRDFSELLLNDLSPFDLRSVKEFELNQDELSHQHPAMFDEEGANRYFKEEYTERVAQIPKAIADSNAPDLEKAVAAYMWENGKTLCGRELNWSLYFMAPFKRDVDCARKFIYVGVPRSMKFLGRAADDEYGDSFLLTTNLGEYTIARGVFSAQLYGIMPVSFERNVWFRNIRVLATLASYPGPLAEGRIDKRREFPLVGQSVTLMSEAEAWDFLYRNNLPDYQALIPKYGEGIWYDSLELSRRIRKPEWFRLETALLYAFSSMRDGTTSEQDVNRLYGAFLEGLGLEKPSEMELTASSVQL